MEFIFEVYLIKYSIRTVCFIFFSVIGEIYTTLSKLEVLCFLIEICSYSSHGFFFFFFISGEAYFFLQGHFQN